LDKRALGRAGEDAAKEYLVGQGYNILYRNFRFGRYGEIDLIAGKDGSLCFIEVKSRSGHTYGTPSEAVGYAKQKNILAVANHYLRVVGHSGQKLRFDVVEVYCEKTGGDSHINIIEIRHIENAFGS